MYLLNVEQSIMLNKIHSDAIDAYKQLLVQESIDLSLVAFRAMYNLTPEHFTVLIQKMQEEGLDTEILFAFGTAIINNEDCDNTLYKLNLEYLVDTINGFTDFVDGFKQSDSDE